MSPRNILNFGLAFSLAGLMALAIYDPGKEIPASKVLLTALKPADIQTIVIEQTKQGLRTELGILTKTVLTKTKKQWQMNSPHNNQANEILINKLLALATAKSHAQYSASKTNLEQLKLLTPELTITLNDTKLYFGSTDAIKGHRYIKIKNTVHLITDSYSYLVRGLASRLLGPTLLPKNLIIRKLILPEFTLQTNDTGWKIIPENKSMSQDQLQQLVDEWHFARALRVDKITAGAKNKIIKVVDKNNQYYLFNLLQTENEIILSRPDIGLQYYFTTETGEKLLNFKPLSSAVSSTN